MVMAEIGVSVDIGTTTAVVSLVNIDTKKPGDLTNHRLNSNTLCTLSAVNAQRFYGADVITRIKYCTKKGPQKLTEVIREQIAGLIEQAVLTLKKQKGTAGEQEVTITSVTIAGNTIMQHIAAGLSPISMGVSPFTPVSLFGTELPIWDELTSLVSLVSPDATMYYTPAISAYIGGDVTSGLLAVDSYLNFEPGGPEAKTNKIISGGSQVKTNKIISGGLHVKTYLYIDIGTNGEIVLKHNDKYYCCATAAGPAFEGAHIKKGMAAVNGAISNVSWDKSNDELKLTVIGDTAPVGLCGSGLLDTL
jgi:uncharacterized 2Fe-2S/4Fe-4S cluster protein (DUF4445 family)